MFESIYHHLTIYRHRFSSDNLSRKELAWIKRLQIINSRPVILFSGLLFKGVGRPLKTGKKKGGIKVHTVIHANEGVPSDIRFTSPATNDSFMLDSATLNSGDIMVTDPVYIDYRKFEELIQREVVYVTKMKKNLKYKVMNEIPCIRYRTVLWRLTCSTEYPQN